VVLNIYPTETWISGMQEIGKMHIIDRRGNYRVIQRGIIPLERISTIANGRDSKQASRKRCISDWGFGFWLYLCVWLCVFEPKTYYLPYLPNLYSFCWLLVYHEKREIKYYYSLLSLVRISAPVKCILPLFSVLIPRSCRDLPLIYTSRNSAQRKRGYMSKM